MVIPVTALYSFWLGVAMGGVFLGHCGFVLGLFLGTERHRLPAFYQRWIERNLDYQHIRYCIHCHSDSTEIGEAFFNVCADCTVLAQEAFRATRPLLPSRDWTPLSGGITEEQAKERDCRCGEVNTEPPTLESLRGIAPDMRSRND